MILMHKFLSQKSIDELVTALAMLAERRRSYYATIQLVRAARTGIDEPIIHPRASVTRLDGDMAEVTFFRADAPDDETPGTVNRWQYLDENGEPVNGKVIEVTLEHDPIGTVITFVCCDEEYLTEFRRLLANFGETLPELTERDPEAPTVTPTGDAPSEGASDTAIETKSDDQAGAPAWANQDWYLGMSINERERYDRLRPHKKDWEAGNITDAELAKLFSKHITTVARWRRELKKQKAPDMDWQKQQGSQGGLHNCRGGLHTCRDTTPPDPCYSVTHRRSRPDEPLSQHQCPS